MDQLLKDFEILSELILSQMEMTRQLFIVNKGKEKDSSLYEIIEKNEKLIDGMDLKIREEVINAIFLFTPKASDLRKIIAYHDMTNYLERIGDLILNVTHFTQKFNPELVPAEQCLDILHSMFTYAQGMIKNAIISFTCEDNKVAYETIAIDDKVDALFKEVIRMMGQSFEGKVLTSGELENLMYLNSISYNIERIADNATNIAESAVYLTEGKDIRHRK
ncbi:MAG: phosphate uptake regulator PhoU [Candidatus Azobacteroides sp.]|nr:phosphate uptake regulator PhoU [Candidatus Azobacteroides sp.]